MSWGRSLAAAPWLEARSNGDPNTVSAAEQKKDAHAEDHDPWLAPGDSQSTPCPHWLHNLAVLSTRGTLIASTPCSNLSGPL